MGKLTHTVKGPIASFRSADKANIESLKLHFLPKQEGSGDPSPTNIRPITGWTGCNLFKTKKNLLDISNAFCNSTATLSNGVVTNNVVDTRAYVSLYIEAIKKVNTSYSRLKLFRMSGEITEAVHYTTGVLTVSSECEDMEYLRIKHNGSSKDFAIYFPLKLPVGAKFAVTLDITGADISTIGGFSMTNFHMEVDTASDTLEQYEGSTIPLSWFDHGVEYGGYIDPVNGKLVAEYKAHVFNGEENISNYSGTFTGGIRLANDTFDDCTGVGALTKCDKAALESTTPSDISRLGIRIGGGVYKTYFYVPDSMFDGEATVDKFKQWLSENGLTIVAKLTTPIEYDIDPITLQTFLDYNNFWTDMNDDTEVEYAFADRLSIRKPEFDTPHVASASSLIASFSTDLKAPIVDLKAHFAPVQEGTGDPGPTNIRPIYGRCSLGIFHTNDNLIDYTSLPCFDAANAQHSFNEDTLTVSVKTAGSAYNVYYQTSLRWIIPENLRGKTVRFVCGGIVNSNSTHHGVMIGEFRKKDGTLIADPTMFNESDNTLSRSYTIPADAVYAVFIFRMNQSTSVTFSDGDYIRFNGVGINYDSSDTEYHKYRGQYIPVLFPSIGNILNIGLTDLIKPGANDSNITISKDTGVISIDAVATSARSHVIFSQVFPAGTYVIQAQNDGAVSRARLLLDIESDGFTYNTYYAMYVKTLGANNNLVFTLSAPSRIGLVLQNGTTGSPGRLYDIQLESGSNPSTFELYEDKYFGGYIDLIRGKIVAEYEILTDTWGNWGTAQDQGDGTVLRVKKFVNPVYGNGITNHNTDYCNVAKYQYANNNGTTHYYIVGQSYNCRVYLPDSFSTDQVIQVIGKLITPIEYDLTPEQIKAFLGQNNIFDDSNGNVEVKYWTH